MIPGGKIMGPTPNLVNPSTVIAEKVANLAVPASANTMWDKLGSKPGLGTAPKMAGGMAMQTPGSYGTSRLQHLSTQLADNDRYKSPLPNLEGGPKSGIGSAMQGSRLPKGHYEGDGHNHAKWDQEVAGGKGSGMNKGNTVFVDDKNFPVTLSEIIGSRMLTQEQLQKASIDNVKKLFRVGLNSTGHKGSASVGNKEENEELYYMAQRMMIEGFVRGVDITKELERQGGLNIAIRGTSYNANASRNIGLSTSDSNNKTMDSVNFNARFWRNANEAERYTLFLHELGHNLLNRPELGKNLKYDIMGDGPIGVAKKLMSSKETYNKILDQHFGAATNKGTIAMAAQLKNGAKTAQFDPSWFPQLSGEQVALGGQPGQPKFDPQAPTPKDYTNDFAGINDNFAKLSAMMEAQNQAMQQFQQQETIANVDTSAPDSSIGQAQLNAPTTTQAVSSSIGGGGGSIDTTGFAQQLQALGSGGGGVSAGNLLSSG